MPFFSSMLLAGGVAEASWDITTASYDNINKPLYDQLNSMKGLFFSSDGTKMYGLNATTNYGVYQYTLSTAWDVSTASYANKSKSVSSQSTQPSSLSFSSDGTKMYVLDYGAYTVFQYTLSTAWDVSTASYASKSYGFGSQSTHARCLSFNDDGTKFYLLDGNVEYKVFQYTLSTAWDVSTASYASKSKSVSSQSTSSLSTFFKPDGTIMYLGADIVIYQYTLSTAWDVSTASYANKSKDFTANQSGMWGFYIKDDGKKLYTSSSGGRTVYQHTLT